MAKKMAEYVFNGGFKTGFLKWWCSFVAEVIITKSIFIRNIIAKTEVPDPALLTPWIVKAIRWAFFGTGAHDPDALDVVIAGYEIIGLPTSKHFQPERVLKIWFR